MSNKAPIRFTGKGAPDYGKIQQENLMRLAENFADSVPPLYPTVGLQWFDSSLGVLKVCVAVTADGAQWRTLSGAQKTTGDAGPPTPASIGDLWSQGRAQPDSDNPYPSATGTLYTYTGLGRHPQVGTTNGGWHQIWPQIEIAAGREEYDVAAGLLQQLAGSIDNGGNEILGTLAPKLQNFAALDVDLRNKFTDLSPTDSSVLTPANAPLTELQVDTTSQDWDTLLAVSKLAVSRLDLPESIVNSISPIPFVSDGRPIPTWLRRLQDSNVMYPSLERRSNRRFGMVTISRLFTETINTLSNAIANRYSLKGISGATGPNAAFASNTLIIPHRSVVINFGNTSSASSTLKFNFSSEKDMKTFLYSGGAFQLTMTHTPNPQNPTSADTDLKSLTDSRGVLRLTMDKTRVLTNAAQPAMLVAPTPIGLQEVLPANKQGLPTLFVTKTVGMATYKITVTRVNSTQITMLVEVSSTSPLDGSINLAWSVIKDSSTYMLNGIATPAFGSPLPYQNGDNS